MFNNKVLASKLYARMVAQKKISRVSFSEDDVLYVLDVIDMVNALHWTACEINGIPLDKVKIPECLKFKVMPGRVSFNVGSKYPDLRYVNVSHEVEIDLARLVNIADCIYGSVKMDTKLVDLAQLRGVVDLNGVNYAVRIGDEWRVVGDYTSPYYPITLHDEVAPIIGAHVANESAEYLVEEFLIQFKIN